MLSRRIIFIILSLFSIGFLGAQETFLIKGTVKDASTNELLFGVGVMAKPGVGAITDMDGNFEFKIEPGTYSLKINYVGYAAQSIKVKVVDKDVTVSVLLESTTLDEVEITANVGTIRETPVAISNISQQKIQEELAGRDLPMLLNSTPGVYATQQGGGSGDSRVTLRGFDQANIAILVDGVPVNDMENAAVYWSNWDGLSEITKNLQVQRGLGATKLAVSSAGGTMNIITNTIDQKRSTVIKRDYGNNNYQRTSLGYNSGLIKGKFGVVLAGSYKTGNGYIDGTFIEAWSYFAKFQWKPNIRHLISLSVNGAPQKHGQRNSKSSIGLFSQSYAAKVGVTDPQANMLASGFVNTTLGERPRTYNYEVAKINGEDFYVSTNYYNKPLFNLSHFWNVTDKLTISTVGYASFGFGGGTDLNTGVTNNPNTGYMDLTYYYNDNLKYPVPNSLEYKYYGNERSSSKILYSKVNNHRWYGLLSTGTYKLDTAFTLTFGVDARYYRGLHYGQISDLMGGDYYLDGSDYNSVRGIYNPFNPSYIDPNYKEQKLRVGDKIKYNYDGLVNWGGLFSQLEYKKNQWTAFATLTGSYTGYQRKDYFSKKDIVLGGQPTGIKKFYDYFKDNRADNVMEAIIGYNQTLLATSSSTKNDPNSYIIVDNAAQTIYQHSDTTFVVSYKKISGIYKPIDTNYIVGANAYTIDSKEAQYAKTRKKWFPGFTIKGGVNYKINSNFNVYANVGVLSVAPKFNNVYNGNAVGNKEFSNVFNQLISSQEVGMGVKFKQFAGNLNVYYTLWNNRPVNTQTYDGITYNINGVNSSHKGVELDWVYKIIKQVEWEGTVSVADWKYINGARVDLIDPYTFQVDTTITFDAKNVRMGNAAQLQFSNGIRFNIAKGLFIKPRYTYFGKNFANFDPISLHDGYARKQSWKMPNYGLLDISAGYNIKFDGFNITLNAGLTNALNTFYISDAQNNSLGNKNTFDANSATVFIGMGRQYNCGVKITF